jgi:hypothetical protein
MDDLKVKYKDRSTAINKELLDTQKCWHNLDKIKSLHKKRLELEEKMSNETDSGLLRQYDSDYSFLEFDLQDAWLFPRDARYHRFWNRPKCTCAKMDNDDRYPTGFYVISKSCMLHGGDVDEEDRSWAV